MRLFFESHPALFAIAFGLAASLSGVGCGRLPQATEMPGIYIANYGFAIERLNLLSNGLYYQEIAISSGRSFVTNGVWSFNSLDGYVTFSGPFLAVQDEFGRPMSNVSLQAGQVILPARKTGSMVQINNTDSQPYYKQPSASIGSNFEKVGK